MTMTDADRLAEIREFGYSNEHTKASDIIFLIKLLDAATSGSSAPTDAMKLLDQAIEWLDEAACPQDDLRMRALFGEPMPATERGMALWRCRKIRADMSWITRGAYAWWRYRGYLKAAQQELLTLRRPAVERVSARGEQKEASGTSDNIKNPLDEATEGG